MQVCLSPPFFWRGGMQEFVAGFRAVLLLSGLFGTMEEIYILGYGHLAPPQTCEINPAAHW